MTEKIIGYILLAAGVIIILFSASSAYNVFIKKTVPLNFFDLQGITIQANKQAGIPEMEIFPKSSINGIVNLVAYIALMGFVGSVGYKIASLGVGLLRPVVIKQKNPPLSA